MDRWVLRLAQGLDGQGGFPWADRALQPQHLVSVEAGGTEVRKQIMSLLETEHKT